MADTATDPRTSAPGDADGTQRGSPLRRLPALVFWAVLLGTIVHALSVPIVSPAPAGSPDGFDRLWEASVRFDADPRQIAELPAAPAAETAAQGEPDETPTAAPQSAPPTFLLLFGLLKPLGPTTARILWSLLGALAVLGVLPLARRIVRRASETRAWDGADGGNFVLLSVESAWPGRLGVLVLLPFVHLALRSYDSVVLQLVCVLAGVAALPDRPLRAGVAFAAATAIEPWTAVFVPLLFWKRSFTALGSMLCCMAVGVGATLAALGLENGIEVGSNWIASAFDDSVLGEYHARYQGLPSFLLATVVPLYQEQTGHTPTGETWNGVRNFLASESLAHNVGLLVGFVAGAIATGCAAAIRWSPRPDTSRRWLLESGMVLCALLLVTPSTSKVDYWLLYPAILAACIEWREAFRGTWARAFLVVVLLTQTLPHREWPEFVWRAFQVFHGFAVGAAGLWALMFLRLWRARSEPEG